MPQYQPKFIGKNGIPSKHQGSHGEVRYGKVDGKLFLFMKVGTDWHSIPFTGSQKSGRIAESITDTITAITSVTATAITNVTAETLTVDRLTITDKLIDGASNAIDATNLVQHPDISSQAHSDYLLNHGDDTMSGSLRITGGDATSKNALRIVGSGGGEQFWVSNLSYNDGGGTPYAAGRVGLGVIESAVLGRLHILTDNDDFIVEDSGNVKVAYLSSEGGITSNSGYRIGDGTNFEVFTNGTLRALGGIDTGVSSSAFVDVYPQVTIFTPSDTIENLAGNHQGSVAMQWGVIADSITDTELAFNTGQDLTKDYGEPEFVKLGVGGEVYPSIPFHIVSPVRDKIIMSEETPEAVAVSQYVLWNSAVDAIYADEIGDYFLYVSNAWISGDSTVGGIEGQLIVSNAVQEGSRVIQRVEHVPGSGNIVDNYGNCSEGTNDHDTKTECDANITGAANHPAWVPTIAEGSFFIYITLGGSASNPQQATWYPGGVTIGTSNTGDMNLRPSSGGDVTITNSAGMGSETYFSGWLGSGWNVSREATNEYLLEVDNLSVRGHMSVYELVINQIRATNGSLIIGSTDRVLEIGNEYSGGGQAIGVNLGFENFVENGTNFDDSWVGWEVTSLVAGAVKVSYNENENVPHPNSDNALKFKDSDAGEWRQIKTTASVDNFVDGHRYMFSAWIDFSANNQTLYWRWAADGSLDELIPYDQWSDYALKTISKDWNADAFDMIGFYHPGQDGYVQIQFDDCGMLPCTRLFTIESDADGDVGGAEFVHFIEGDLIIAQKWSGAVGEPPYTPIAQVKAEVYQTYNTQVEIKMGQFDEGDVNIATGSTSEPWFRVGLRVVHADFPINARIVSITDETHYVLSSAPLADGFNQNMTYHSHLSKNEFLAHVEPTIVQGMPTLEHIDSTPLDFVRIGNISDVNRMGGIYLTSEDTGAPFIEIYNEVDSWDDWRDSDKAKARLGKLDGITYDGQSLSGYGLFSDNAWLTGKITATTGYIGDQDKGWKIDEFGIENTTADVDARIGIGSDGYGDANQKFWVDGSGRFSLGDKLTWDGSDLTVTGTINIESGADVGVGFVWEYALDPTSAPETQEISLAFAQSSMYTTDFDLMLGTQGYIRISRLDQAGQDHNTQMGSMQPGEIFKIVERNNPAHMGIYEIKTSTYLTSSGGQWRFWVNVLYANGAWDQVSGDGHADVLTGFGAPGQDFNSAWMYQYLVEGENPNAPGEYRMLYESSGNWYDADGDWSIIGRMRIWPIDGNDNDISSQLENLFYGEGIKWIGHEDFDGSNRYGLYIRGPYSVLNNSGYYEIDMTHIQSGADTTGSTSYKPYNLQIGPVGIAGNPGSEWILNTQEIPTDSWGNVGDMYMVLPTQFGESDYDIYEKTGALTWTYVGNIQGPGGTNGSDGATGVGIYIPYDDFRPTPYGTGTPDNGDMPVPWNSQNSTGDEVYSGWWGMYDDNFDSTQTWDEVRYLMVSSQSEFNSMSSQMNLIVDSDVISITCTGGNGGKFRVTNRQSHTGAQGPHWYTFAAQFIAGSGSAEEEMNWRHTPALIFDVFGGDVPNPLAGINTTGGLSEGLLITSDVWGFHGDIDEGDGTNATLADFSTYMDFEGNFYLGGSTEPTTGDKGWLAWVAGTNSLKIKGEVGIATSFGEIDMSPPKARIVVARHIINEHTQQEFGHHYGWTGTLESVGTVDYAHNILYNQGYGHDPAEYNDIEVSGSHDAQGTITMEECREFDIVIIDYYVWGTSMDWDFIHSLIDDGQRVLVYGNDGGFINARFVTSAGFNDSAFTASLNPPDGPTHPIMWEESWAGTTSDNSSYPSAFIEGVTILGEVRYGSGNSFLAHIGCIYKNESSGGIVVCFASAGDDMTDAVTRTRAIWYLQGFLTDSGETMGTAATLKEGVVIDKGGIQLADGGSIKTYGINYGEVGIFFGYDTTETADVLSVVSATNSLLWDGTDLTVSGKINATEGAFSGFVTAGGMQIGTGISAGANKNGIWVATNDYWYDDETFSLGAGAIEYSSSTLTIDADTFAIGGVTIGTSGTTIQGQYIEISGSTTFSGVPSNHEIALPMHNVFHYHFGGDVGELPNNWDAIWHKIIGGSPVYPEVISIGVADGAPTDNYTVGSIGNNPSEAKFNTYNNVWVPYDGVSTYRVQARVKQANAAGTCSIGVAGMKGVPTSMTLVSVTGAASDTAQHFFALDEGSLTANFEIYEGFFKGHAASGNGGEHNEWDDTGTMHTDTTHITPHIGVNQGAAAGNTVVDWIRIDRFSGGITEIDGDWITTGHVKADNIDVDGLVSAGGLLVASSLTDGSTSISGSNIDTGTITSNNHTGTSDGSGFATTGMAINLSDGSISAKNFRIEADGDAEFSGELGAFSGDFSGDISASTITFAVIGDSPTKLMIEDYLGNNCRIQRWGSDLTSGSEFDISDTITINGCRYGGVIAVSCQCYFAEGNPEVEEIAIQYSVNEVDWYPSNNQEWFSSGFTEINTEMWTLTGTIGIGNVWGNTIGRYYLRMHSDPRGHTGSGNPDGFLATLLMYQLNNM